MERNPTNEYDIGRDLARLKALADDILHKDDQDPNLKTGLHGWFLARKKEGVYALIFGMTRQQILEFTEDLTVLAAEIYWRVGDPDYYSGEYEPIAKWRFKKWRQDYERQVAEGAEVLRFGDDNYAEYRQLIKPEKRPQFISAFLGAVEKEITENSSPETEETIPGTPEDIRVERGIMRYLYHGGRGSANLLPREWPDTPDEE